MEEEKAHGIGGLPFKLYNTFLTDSRAKYQSVSQDCQTCQDNTLGILLMLCCLNGQADCGKQHTSSSVLLCLHIVACRTQRQHHSLGIQQKAPVELLTAALLMSTTMCGSPDQVDLSSAATAAHVALLFSLEQDFD